MRSPTLLASLLILGAGAPARAGQQTNGVNMNGVNMNGVNMNGVNMNGVNMNGVNMNGVTLGSIKVNATLDGDAHRLARRRRLQLLAFAAADGRCAAGLV